MFKDKNGVCHFLLCKTTVAPSDGLVVYFLSMFLFTKFDW